MLCSIVVLKQLFDLVWFRLVRNVKQTLGSTLVFFALRQIAHFFTFDSIVEEHVQSVEKFFDCRIGLLVVFCLLFFYVYLRLLVVFRLSSLGKRAISLLQLFFLKLPQVWSSLHDSLSRVVGKKCRRFYFGNFTKFGSLKHVLPVNLSLNLCVSFMVFMNMRQIVQISMHSRYLIQQIGTSPRFSFHPQPFC